MSFIADRVYQTATNPGSGAVTPNAAVAGYATFSSGVPNGSTLTIAIENQTPGEWEICDAVWNGTTLTRGPLLSSSTGSRVTFTGPVNVFSTASAKYINTPAGHADALGFKSNSSTALATTGASGTGTTATITFATQGSAPYAVGSYISVAGVTSSTYNGLYVVTACTTTSVSYASTATLTHSVAGTICQAVVLTKDSSFYQIIASGSTQSAFVLPDTSTLQQGWSFRITNGTSNSVLLAVYTSTGVSVASYGANQTYYFTCIDTTVNTAAAWRVGITDVGSATGSGSMVLGTSPTITGNLTFNGSNTSASVFHTTQSTATMTMGGTAATGLINIGRSTASQPIQIGSGITATSTTASGTASSITTTVLTVGGTVTGTFSIGMALSGVAVLPGTYIISFGTGTGGAGTYNINQTQTVASTTITGTTQKSIDIGTGGTSGSVTAITLGSATTGATSTTTINGKLIARSGVSVGTAPIDVIDSSGNLLITVPITKGGTGATTAGAALTALGAESSANKGVANGYAPLDATTKIASTYLPSYVDDVLEYANLASFPATGETGKIYVALDTNKCYRWSGSAYVYITSGAVDSVGGLTGVVTLTGLGLNNVTNESKATMFTSPTFTGTVSGVTSSAVGLGNVTNESKATMFTSPTFTGTVNGIKPRVNSAATVTSPLAWDSTSFDQYALTGLANALTISADANSSPADGQKMTFRIKDNGTARALTWTTGSTNSFRVVGTTLPTTTVISKILYVGCIYNVTDSRWDVVAVGQEA